MPTTTDVQPFPAGFGVRNVDTNGTTLSVRVGGQGPAASCCTVMVRPAICGRRSQRSSPMTIPLLSPICVGWGSPLVPKAATTRRPRVTTSPACSTRSRSSAADLVTHDIGNMVGYAFAAQYPDRVIRFVVMDAPLPGVGPWEEMLKNPLLWHFRFGGPDMERLVAGRERIYLDRFWNEFSADPKRSARSPANIMPSYMRSPAQCTPVSPSSPHSTRTPSTTRLRRRGQVDHAGARSRRREVVWAR